MRFRAVHDALLSWGAFVTRDAGRVHSARGFTLGPAVHRSFFQPCPLCFGRGHIKNGTTERCPACNGRGGNFRRVMLINPGCVRRTGPGGMSYTPDPDNRRLNRTPAVFAELEAALYELSLENLAVTWSRYVAYPKPHATTRNGERVGGTAARLAFVNDAIRPHQMNRAQYSERLMRVRRDLSAALNLPGR